MDGRPRQFDGVEDCVEQALSRVGRRIVLCTPIGAVNPSLRVATTFSPMDPF